LSTGYSIQKDYAMLVRSGNALVVTMIITALVVALVSNSADAVFGSTQLQKLDQDRLRAEMAAESIVELIERRLYSLAASDAKKLQESLESHPNDWLGLQGFDYGGSRGTDDKALYFNGCAIRWRIEPTKIAAATRKEATEKNTTFFVNSERNPDLQPARKAAAEDATKGGGTNRLLADEAQHFHFMIVVQAYALKQPLDVATVPWIKPNRPNASNHYGKHTYHAELQRVIQLEDVNPFRYLFNYVANSPIGDLEMSPVSPVTFSNDSRLHSNQRIYFSGSENIVINTDTSTGTAIEGADGIFHLDKADEYSNGRLSPQLSVGNAPSSVITLNNVVLDLENDSRQPTGVGTMRSDGGKHHEAVKDGKDGRIVQVDIKNYEDWNTGFSESFVVVGAGRPYRLLDGIHGKFYSSNNTNGRHPFLDSTDPNYSVNDPTPPVLASETPQFLIPNGGNEFTDAWPSDPSAPWDLAHMDNGGQKFYDIFTAVPSTPITGHVTEKNVASYVTPTANAVMASTIVTTTTTDTSTNPPTVITASTKTYQHIPNPPENPNNPTQVQFSHTSYFNALMGSTSNRASDLVIRERYRSAGIYLPARTPKPDPLTPANIDQYSDWLKDNYIVYLGRRIDPSTGSRITVDITNQFFNFTRTATSVNDLIAREDTFTNQRDAQWFNNTYGRSPLANVLTLNIEKIYAFLGSPTPTGTYNLGGNYSNFWNKIIHVERAHRVFVDTNPGKGAELVAHPLAPYGYNPFLLGTSWAGGPVRLDGGYDIDNTGSYFFPIVGTVDNGMNTSLIPGTTGTWTVYPTANGVRIKNAANITGRLAISTPNTLYVWGDLNTKFSNPSPVGLYADTIIALSNDWKDQQSALPLSSRKATATTYRAGVVTNNIPTDLGNAANGGGGGALNIMRFLEDWEGVNYNFEGAIVVMGRSRYTNSPIYGTDFHKPPNYNYVFNPDLAFNPPPQSPTTTKGRVLFNAFVSAQQ
jgi:hypothetical protein